MTEQMSRKPAKVMPYVRKPRLEPRLPTNLLEKLERQSFKDIDL